MKIIERLNTRHFINKCYVFDKRRFVKFSRALHTSGADHIVAQMAICTHVIEKGLTMPEMRHGFGQEMVTRLIGLCREWSEKYDKSNHFFLQAAKVILEYNSVHDKLAFSFKDPFLAELKKFVGDFSFLKPSEQILSQGKEQFFSKLQASFPEFAQSRHSVRNFSNQEIPVQELMDSIKLAQCAPSACNRQSTRIHVVTGKKDIQAILSIQNGNRGFSNLIDKLLIVTYDVTSYGSVRERNLGFVDSGIFTMNLLYALHCHQIGTCPLNWCDSPKDDAKLRSIVAIDEKESVTILIACGYVPDHEFKIAKSERIDSQSIITVH